MRLVFPATLLVFLSALWVKAIYPGASGISDTDFFWHLSYGRWIIEHGALPAGDVFSWSMPGEPYRMTQWLGELIMGYAYQTSGLHGTKALAVILAGITIGVGWLAARRYVHTSYALGISLLCNLIAVVTPMRPQLFSFAMLAIMAWIVAVWMTNGSRRIIWAIPPLMMLWVNLHGGYVVGVLLLGLFCLGQWISALREGKLRDSIRTLLPLTAACGAGVLATLINPYGIGAWESVAMISGLRSSSVLAEWRVVDLTDGVGWFYLLNAVPYIGLLILGARPTITHGMLASFFLFFGYLANRQVAMMAAVMPMLVAALVAKSAQYQKMLPEARNPSKPVAFSLIAFVMLASFVPIQRLGDANVEKNMAAHYPVQATSFLKQHGIDKRVLSDTLESSYLIFEKVPVFIDGRLDLYKDKFFFENVLAMKGAAGWEALLERHKPGALLLRNDVALRQLAAASGRWDLVYEDGKYSVLVPANGDSGLPAVTARKIAYLDDRGRMIRAYQP